MGMIGVKASDFTFTNALIDLESLFDGIEEPLSAESRKEFEQEAILYEESLKQEDEYYIVSEEESRQRREEYERNSKKSDEIDSFSDNIKDLSKELGLDIESDVDSDKDISNLFGRSVSLAQALSNDSGGKIPNPFDKKLDVSLSKENLDVLSKFEDSNLDFGFESNKDSFLEDVGEDVANDIFANLGDNKDDEHISEEVDNDIFASLDNKEDKDSQEIKNPFLVSNKNPVFREITNPFLVNNGIEEPVVKEMGVNNKNLLVEEDKEELKSLIQSFNDDELNKDVEKDLGDLSGGLSLFNDDSSNNDEMDRIDKEMEKLRLENEEAERKEQERKARLAELSRQRELAIQKEKEIQKQKEKERQRVLELERQKEFARQQELERQKALELEKQKESKKIKNESSQKVVITREKLIVGLNKYYKQLGKEVDFDDFDDDETLELKLRLAKLEYKKALRRKMQEEENNSNVSQPKTKQTKNKLPSGIDVATKTVSEHEKELASYSAMSTDDLFKIVKQYLLAKGVKKSLVSLDDVTLKFGKDNIRRLKEKNYIIIIRNGITLGQM